MGKTAAAVLMTAVVLLALLLPELLLYLDDRAYLDEVHLLTETEDAGFENVCRMTTAEKLVLIRTGSVRQVELPRDSGDIAAVSAAVRGGRLVPLEENRAGVQSAPADEVQRSDLWADRMVSAYREIVKLQTVGALPSLWRDGDVLTLGSCGESLCVNTVTSLGFPVYTLELWGAPCGVHVTVDGESGRILSIAVACTEGAKPVWEKPSLEGWRDYWGMDRLVLAPLEDTLQPVLTGRNTAFTSADRERQVERQVDMTYDQRTIHIPLVRREPLNCGGFIVQWNYGRGEPAVWRYADRVLSQDRLTANANQTVNQP